MTQQTFRKHIFLCFSATPSSTALFVAYSYVRYNYIQQKSYAEHTILLFFKFIKHKEFMKTLSLIVDERFRLKIGIVYPVTVLNHKEGKLINSFVLFNYL